MSRQFVPVQQSCVGEQLCPSVEQVCGGVQTQPVALLQAAPVASRQVVLSPGQHAFVGEHDGSGWPAVYFAQVAAGTSQVQVVSPAAQGA